MVKLISQFDNEKSKLTVATPTCGACCCCCCCCIVSAIIATGVGKRNFGGQAPDSSPAMNARHYDPTSGNAAGGSGSVSVPYEITQVKICPKCKAMNDGKHELCQFCGVVMQSYSTQDAKPESMGCLQRGLLFLGLSVLEAFAVFMILSAVSQWD